MPRSLRVEREANEKRAEPAAQSQRRVLLSRDLFSDIGDAHRFDGPVFFSPGGVESIRKPDRAAPRLYNNFDAPMRTFAWVWFLAVSAVGFAKTESQIVRSFSELSSLGIAVERVQLSTPMASVEIGALIDPKRSPGQYELTECVVLEDKISEPKLVDADISGVGVARRSDSTKLRSIFLVRGKEVPNAYLAFQFASSSDPAEKRRYLLPVTRVAEN